MIEGLSRAITQHLAPLLSLTSLLLIVFAYLAPNVMLSTRVALLIVAPSTGSNSSQSSDGPTVFMGALGSCSRPNSQTGVVCTTPTVSPIYDLSVLPSNVPDLLTSPPASSPAFIAVSIAFAVIFFFMFTFSAHRDRMGRFGANFYKPVVQRVTAWIGFLGFIIGLTSFVVVYMWFGKAVDDFNDDISKETDAPALSASTSNGFIMIWVAYAFYAVPLVSSLAKLHMATTVSKV
ncbi:hypothetical protein B0H21DRAFT_883577 [Amylocystis lapponica]|nr:hypothetical protein B0H21DRAFT_883577 [Amylocystis lapponica]